MVVWVLFLSPVSKIQTSILSCLRIGYLLCRAKNLDLCLLTFLALSVTEEHRSFNPLFIWMFLSLKTWKLGRMVFRKKFLKLSFFFLKKDFVYLFLEKGEGEKHQYVVASHVAPTGDPACNPGMCPDWESNQWPFSSQPVLNPLSYTSQG